MKRFQFNLKTLLKVRETKLKGLQNKLAKRQESLDTCLKKEEKIKSDIRGLEEEIVLKRKEGSFQDLAFFDRYLTSLREKEREVAKEKRLAKREIHQEKVAILESFQKRIVVEKLKEKKYSLWKKKLD